MRALCCHVFFAVHWSHMLFQLITWQEILMQPKRSVKMSKGLVARKVNERGPASQLPVRTHVPMSISNILNIIHKLGAKKCLVSHVLLTHLFNIPRPQSPYRGLTSATL